MDIASSLYGTTPLQAILRADGTVWAFGTNIYGEAGDPLPPSGQVTTAPQPVPGLTGIKLP